MKGKGFGLTEPNDGPDPDRQDLSKWSEIPRHTAIRIYKHYFADFGMFQTKVINRIIGYRMLHSSYYLVLTGYPPEAALDFINSADDKKPAPAQSIIRQSRKNLQPRAAQFLSGNQDFLC